MKILALDLSTKSSGYALIEGRKLLEWGCFTASSSDPIARIKKISVQLAEFLDKNPDLNAVVMEEVRPEGNITRNQHTQKMLMYLQAAVILLLHEYNKNLQIEFYYPSQWRKINKIPQGAGVKREVQKINDIQYVKDTFNIDVNDDEADAIGLGTAYAKMHT